MSLSVGDWVGGRSSQGELIHGYVEAVNLFQGLVAVQIVASDREAAIGKAVTLSLQDVRKLPVSSADNEEQLRSLIDIALGVKDADWFFELSGKLLALQGKGSKGVLPVNLPAHIRNRLNSRSA